MNKKILILLSILLQLNTHYKYWRTCNDNKCVTHNKYKHNGNSHADYNNHNEYMTTIITIAIVPKIKKNNHNYNHSQNHINNNHNNWAGDNHNKHSDLHHNNDNPNSNSNDNNDKHYNNHNYNPNNKQ